MTGFDEPVARLIKLERAIAADLSAARGHSERLRALLAQWPWQPDSPVLSVAAVAIHHYYGAIESALERIARTYEGVPKSAAWHRELLEQMALDLPRVRPAVLQGQTVAALGPVLGFRHFFRHAYAVPFDPDRLVQVSRDLIAADALIAVDLARFQAALLTAAQ